MIKKTLTFSLAMLAFFAFAAEKSSNAIVRLLNSRSAGSPREYVEAAEIVAADAAAGRPLQQFILAVVASDADLPPRLRLTADKRKEYLDKSRDKIRLLAEKKNNALAWYLLSLEKNDMKYLKLAADGENVQALNAWGTITLSEVMRDPNAETNDIDAVMSKSFECFKKAADQGDANGLYNLGMCYLRGYGCQSDQSLAFKYLRASAEKGHAEAINNIGGFYRDGIVVEKNLESAAKFFERSASLGNDYGQFNYALALQRGDGVDRDSARALDLFKQAAMRANLGELINERGEDYLCGENGSGLSGGEKQRISIARSLLKDSSVLLADEITAALDSQTAYKVSSDILDLTGLTRIVVTHSLDEKLMKRYDKILVMKNGRIEEQGTFDELMAKRKYFHALFTAECFST